MKRFIRFTRLLALFLILITNLVACGSEPSSNSDSSSGYANSISKGLDAVAENKMNKAIAYFDNALTQKPKDAKAKVYRNQAQAYVDTNNQLKAGEVQKAVTTVTDGVKIKNGAKSLDTKLAQLKTTAKSDLTEYNQLNKDVTAQLSVTDGNYSNDILKQSQKIDWDKKPYLSKLKPKVNQLIKQSSQRDSSSSSEASSSSSSSTARSESGLSVSDAKGKLASLAFYKKNSSHIDITGQQQTTNGWEFTWHFSSGNMGGTFEVNNDGSMSAQASGGGNVGTGNWK